MNYKILGNKIKEIREKELKQTQKEFADSIGISKNTVSRIENATVNVNNIEVYLKICEITGYTMEELISEDKDNTHSKRLKRRINYILKDLEDEELEAIYFSLNKFFNIFHKDQLNKSS